MAALTLTGAVGDAYAQNTSTSAREPIIGLPCEGCEAVFEGLPDTLPSSARLAPENEPGQALRIEGTVYDQGGLEIPGVIVYAYHTDERGIYPPDERLEGQAAYRHGRLRGWARSDDRGRYRFDTIRPGGYADGTTPTHVHMHVIEIRCCTYYIDSIHFLDDPRLQPEERTGPGDSRGGNGLVRPERDEDGFWIVQRDIILGEGVPGYPPPNRSDQRP